jgi:LPXTG-motif cell wall-anchored protein
VLSPRALAAALAASALLGAPGTAGAAPDNTAVADERLLAQSAQGSQNLTPTPQVRPPAPPAPAPSPTPAPPSQLPYTGLDARWLALAGGLLLLGGIGVRIRAADGVR